MLRAYGTGSRVAASVRRNATHIHPVQVLKIAKGLVVKPLSIPILGIRPIMHVFLERVTRRYRVVSIGGVHETIGHPPQSGRHAGSRVNALTAALDGWRIRAGQPLLSIRDNCVSPAVSRSESDPSLSRPR